MQSPWLKCKQIHQVGHNRWSLFSLHAVRRLDQLWQMWQCSGHKRGSCTSLLHKKNCKLGLGGSDVPALVFRKISQTWQNRSRVYLVLPDSLKKTGHDQENCLKVHFCSDYGNCIFLKCNKIASKQSITDLSSFKCEVMYSQRSGKKQKKEFQ